MKASLKEKIYLSVTIVCLLLCAVMIAGMCFGPEKYVSAHLPALRSVSDSEGTEKSENAPEYDAEPSAGQIAVTDVFLNEQLKRFLPDDFPLKDPKVTIGADGIVSLSGNVKKDDLRSFLKSNGIKTDFKYSAALFLLPKQFDLEASLKISEDRDGKLSASPYSLVIANKKIPVSVFPLKVSEMLSDALNKTVSLIDGLFSFSGFEDGAIIFQKKIT